MFSKLHRLFSRSTAPILGLFVLILIHFKLIYGNENLNFENFCKRFNNFGLSSAHETRAQLGNFFYETVAKKGWEMVKMMRTSNFLMRIKWKYTLYCIFLQRYHFLIIFSCKKNENINQKVDGLQKAFLLLTFSSFCMRKWWETVLRDKSPQKYFSSKNCEKKNSHYFGRFSSFSAIFSKKICVHGEG